jgi:hypothetical protein
MVFQRVRLNVRTKTDGKQVPDIASGLEAPFCFTLEKCPVAMDAPTTPACTGEAIMCDPAVTALVGQWRLANFECGSALEVKSDNAEGTLEVVFKPAESTHVWAVEGIAENMVSAFEIIPDHNKRFTARRTPDGIEIDGPSEELKGTWGACG